MLLARSTTVVMRLQASSDYRAARPGSKFSSHKSRHRRLLRRSLVPTLMPLLAATWSFSAVAAGPLPQGGQFVAGHGTIAGNGTGLNISQTSLRGVIDWRSFSIGTGRGVTIDNGSGATLNRVTGGEASNINGLLSGTGSVYLINPQGVLVGPLGVVTTGGRFVASTLNITNDEFMQGGSLTLSGAARGDVINLGKISSTGGDIFLISRTVAANKGTLTASSGTAELGTGSQVLLQDSSSGPQMFVQAGSGGQVLNAGTIRAAQIDLQAADGNVYAFAGRHSALRATGTATRDGHVWLVADGGVVDAHGRVVAKNADGSGGTFDTRANTLHIDGAHVNAAQWNLTAPTFDLGGAAAAALSYNLSRGTSIQVTTTGAGGTSGDLTVLCGIHWHGDASLVLDAYRSINIGPHARIGNVGAGNLTLRADASGIDNGGSVVNRGEIDWSRSTGTVSALYDMNGSYQAGKIDTSPTWSAAPFSGLLTQATAYQLVNSIADLESVSQNLAGNYALGKDLVAAPPNEFMPIGGASAAPGPFTGQFDGMGHTISGLGLSGYLTTGAQGLFSTIGSTGVVRNIGVLNVDLYSPNPQFFGPIAGVNLGLITHAYSSGSAGVGSYAAAAGGLVGQNGGVIERSGSSENLGSAGQIGGLVGINEGLILQSYSTGTVGTGIHGVAGGLVGYNSAAGVIEQSYAAGAVNPSIFSGALAAGGLVAFNDGKIVESFDTSTMAQPYLPLGVPRSVFAYGGITSGNRGVIANNVFWNVDATNLAIGVVSGTPIPAQNGLTAAQMSVPASFGGTYDFSPTGTWVIPGGATHPVLRWQLER